MSLSEKEIALALLENLGGKENVINVKRCATRLRFSLKNPRQVHEENIKRLNGIIGIIEADHQFYIVPEEGLNSNIYDELARRMGLPQVQTEKKSFIARLRDKFRRKQ